MMYRPSYVADDPKYQRIKENLRSSDLQDLLQLKQELEPRVNRREAATALTALAAVAVPIIGVGFTHGLEKIGQLCDSPALIEVAQRAQPYFDSGMPLLFALPVVFGVAIYNYTGKRNRESYEHTAAETLLAERTV